MESNITPMMSKCLTVLFSFFFAVSSAIAIEPTAEEPIGKVKVSKAFFDPLLHQTVAVEMQLGSSGNLKIDVLDRDGFVVRHLVSDKAVQAGAHSEMWDGRDDDGVGLPTEAFRFRVQLDGPSGLAVYDPQAPSMTTYERDIAARYSRANGTITYVLSQASAVHLQVGLARRDPKTGDFHGPVMATIVDHLPRPAGSIVEPWNGYVGETEFFLPDKPDFVISLMASPLPENTVMVSADGREKYSDYAKRHRPKDQIQPRSMVGGSHQNHEGLNVFEDHSPSFKVIPVKGKWVSNAKSWSVTKPLKIRIEKSEPMEYFLSLHPELQLFVDKELVARSYDNSLPHEISVDSTKLTPGEHLLTVNFVSQFGPVGVASIKVRLENKTGGIH